MTQSLLMKIFPKDSLLYQRKLTKIEQIYEYHSCCPFSNSSSFLFFSVVLSSFKNNGTNAKKAMMHSAEKRQKISQKGILGMKIIEIAVKKAAEPSIKDDTLVTLPFSFMLLPMSIAMTVPMMLQGPPMQLPIKNMAMQYCQGSFVSAKDTTNMMTALTSRSGLRIKARLSKRSTKKPTAVPPIRLPRSIILAMQPFCDYMSPPLLPKKTGSQNKRPQMQPLRQEQPSTYNGTRGKHITEKIPYFSLGISGQTYVGRMTTGVSQVFVISQDVKTDSQLGYCAYCTNYSSSSGFSFRNKKIRAATPKAIMPVDTKLKIHEIPLFSNTLQRLDPMIFPTFAFIAHIPIKTPFLFFSNQFPKMPIMPGHPVAWKNPLKHIKMSISMLLQKDVTPKMIGKSIQLALESTSPSIIQLFKVTLCIRLPNTAIPSEQEIRYAASTIPKNSPDMPNYVQICFLEYDHPQRRAWRLAQPKKVSENAMTLSTVCEDFDISNMK